MNKDISNKNYDQTFLNNKIIEEYVNRFALQGFEKPSWPNFFTQLDITSYHQVLPYIFGIEIFNLRLLKAYLDHDTICIYSDYDTDAVTATATMYHGLVELGFEANKISFYAPDRFTEGYGMNPDAVNDLSQKYDLIISVDCGINSREEANLINKLKIEMNSQNKNQTELNKIADLIITDHHQLVGSIPEALGVINPRLNSIYAGDPELLDIFKKKLKQETERTFLWFESHVENLDEKSLELNSFKEKITNWLEKVEHNTKNFDIKSPNYLTSSATGVGVAWFCLVWFGYFLEEIGI
jgi:DHH family